MELQCYCICLQHYNVSVISDLICIGDAGILWVQMHATGEPAEENIEHLAETQFKLSFAPT